METLKEMELSSVSPQKRHVSSEEAKILSELRTTILHRT